jgi:hypothetical protein
MMRAAPNEVRSQDRAVFLQSEISTNHDAYCTQYAFI